MALNSLAQGNLVEELISGGSAMTLGRRSQEQQPSFWIAADELPRSEGHVFYCKLNRLLREASFDEFVESLCEPYYHDTMGRPSIPPGVYFRMLLVGYFEGLGSQRGIAWRCADSLSLREFLGIPLGEETPDHSSLTRVRDRLPLPVHQQVFCFVLRVADEKGLLKGKTVGVDATTLEADAAMKSIVRRDTGEDWQEYVRRLMQDAGQTKPAEEPTAEEIARFDRQRKDKKVSNQEWQSETDPDSRITKMKDGRTHLAYKAEHVVDLDTELILAAEVYHADAADVDTIGPSISQAQDNLIQAESDAEIEEAVADKGYSKNETLAELEFTEGLRTYLAEPKQTHRRNWKDKSEEQHRAVTNNRRRVQGKRGRALQRERSEKVERSFAHVCETGGSRRTWLHGIEKVSKRYLTSAMARNLGLILRHLCGIGTARSLQGEGGLADDLYLVLFNALTAFERLLTPTTRTNQQKPTAN
jgi:transposase